MFMFFLLLILFIAFAIYLWISDGYIYIATNHFEKELNIKQIKSKNKKNTCKTCGMPIMDKETYCEVCKKKQLISYSSSNEFRDTK